MVVECNKCGTRFQLDSSKIPDAGIRVRCSRCKHAFFLLHPDQSQANAVASVVEQAIDREENLSSNAQQTPSVMANSEPTGMEAVQEDSNDQEFIEEEDDWEFNEDLPSYDEEDDDPDEAVVEVDDFEKIEVEGLDDEDDADDFDLNDSNESDDLEAEDGLAAGVDAGEGDAADYSIDLEGSSTNLAGPDPDESGSIDMANKGPIGASHEIGGMGLDQEEMSADHLTSSSMSIDTGLPKAVPVTAESGGGEPSLSGARQDTFGSVEDFSAPAQNEISNQTVPLVGADDATSEDPENWDFFGEQGSPASIGLSPTAMPAQIPAPAPVGGGQVHTRPAHDSSAGGPFELSVDRQLGAVARVASALAWVVFFGLLSTGVYLGVMASVNSGVSTPAFVSIGEMRAANIRGHWLDTARAGTLYVVTGELLNPGTLSAVPSQAVQVRLLGEGGRELGVSPVFAGRDVELDELREMSVDELWSSQRVRALALASAPIGPGQSASFAATFVALPEEATHFQLGAALPERINELAIELGVPIPVVVEEPVPNPDELEPVAATPGAEGVEPEVAAEPDVVVAE